ncbi:MAG: M3 family metallopeptidase [Deltaproteobacteria bacterium]|nr:M3 family metallopeptidase [Deltaproteobacteria bacterium]
MSYLPRTFLIAGTALGFSIKLLGCAAQQQPPRAEGASGTPAVVETDADYGRMLAHVEALRATADQDPMLAPWPGEYGGVPPWDLVTADRFPAAFEKGLELLRAEVLVIAENPEAPTFANTVEALELAGRHQERAEVLFGVMTGNLNTPEVQAVDEAWAPKITAAYDDIVFNEKLFARIAAVYEARASAGLTPEQQRLVERRYEQAVRRGAKLSAEGKAELGRINQALSSLFTEFGNKVLADENTWVVLDGSKDLAGLPEALRASYKTAADERGLSGKWVVVNTRSSVDPFLTFSSRRDLRERVWKAFKNRGDNGNANDTNETIARIVELRATRAKLLGYASHAHWRMADTMAIDPAKASSLMQKVWPAAVARVGEEVKDMQAIAKKEGAKITIEPWDYLYYAEKVRKAKYALDQNELRPYFELNRMIEAAFWMAEELYGLTFHEITGRVPAFHPEVRVFEVKNKADGSFVGLFYGDYFARPAKRSGAWASTYQGHEAFTGAVVKPLTSNNNNFVKGAAGEPVLISLDDARTLFHEFGHALHSLLSKVNYPGLASTPRDFVEYPSQVHEMWVLTRPVLDRFATHYKTKKPMPQSLLDKIAASSKFNQGYETVEYLSAAIVDMALHTRADGKVDPDAFERETLEKIGAPKEVAMRHRLPQFNHLFTSDAYSAGYYSYLWSEVMDADTREAFAETGNVFDRATAEKLEQFILAPGNSTDRSEAYRNFRGRDPSVAALLRKRGFPVPN